jgi:hypothetical protein
MFDTTANAAPLPPAGPGSPGSTPASRARAAAACAVHDRLRAREDRAFAAGQAAFRRGAHSSVNPHDGDDALWAAWNAGFWADDRAARAAARAA